MFTLSKEQETELLRLQHILSTKRKLFDQLKQELEYMDSPEQNMIDKLNVAEEELRIASYNFNDFIGSLPLEKF